jgi:hypothetical protein
VNDAFRASIMADRPLRVSALAGPPIEVAGARSRSLAEMRGA